MNEKQKTSGSKFFVYYAQGCIWKVVADATCVLRDTIIMIL